MVFGRSSRDCLPNHNELHFGVKIPSTKRYDFTVYAYYFDQTTNECDTPAQNVSRRGFTIK